MTTTALITMIIAWTVIIFFALCFFIKVLKTPSRKDETEKKE
jgi:preprotein translocase subunit SecG